MRIRGPLPLAGFFTLGILAAAAGTGAGCGGGDGGAGGGNGGGTPKKDGTIVVLFTSDEHSHLFAGSPELDDYPPATAAGTGTRKGGIARRAAVLAAERKAATAAGKDPITLSSGDNVMGGLAQTAYASAGLDYTLMKALAYDVTTLGNHELDFGPANLAKAITAAKAASSLPPIVASNIHFSSYSADDDTLAALYSDTAGDSAAIHPYRVITTASGHKVGVLGFVGVNAEHVATNKTPVKFSSLNVAPSLEGDLPSVLPELYNDIQPVVDTLRDTEEVDLVIGLSHAGIADLAKVDESEDALIANNVTGIDLIISGHAHQVDPAPIQVKDTLILNGGAYGNLVGRVEFKVFADGSKPTWDTATQKMLDVDDTTVPDQATAATTDSTLATIERAPFLSGLLSRVTGTTVTDDTGKAGDLYFFPIGKTAFDVVERHSVEALSADSMLAAADAWGAASGTKTHMGLESGGVVRSVLKKGATGFISAADAFDVVPLGLSPTDGTLGYPLVRAYLARLELQLVFEAAIAVGRTRDDFDLVPAGVRIEYDLTRPPALSAGDQSDPNKGMVMRILLDSHHSDGFEQYDTVIFDRANPANANTTPVSLFAVVTSSYIAQFAADVGAGIKDDEGIPLTIPEVVLHRSDNSEIKQVEAFLEYIHASPGGTLPTRYDATAADATKRFVCTNGC